jgi:hypothetical protein
VSMCRLNELVAALVESAEAKYASLGLLETGGVLNRCMHAYPAIVRHVHGKSHIHTAVPMR